MYTFKDFISDSMENVKDCYMLFSCSVEIPFEPLKRSALLEINIVSIKEKEQIIHDKYE